jgi:hypothetical protein
MQAGQAVNGHYTTGSVNKKKLLQADGEFFVSVYLSQNTYPIQDSVKQLIS